MRVNIADAILNMQTAQQPNLKGYNHKTYSFLFPSASTTIKSVKIFLKTSTDPGSNLQLCIEYALEFK